MSSHVYSDDVEMIFLQVSLEKAAVVPSFRHKLAETSVDMHDGNSVTPPTPGYVPMDNAISMHT